MSLQNYSGGITTGASLGTAILPGIGTGAGAVIGFISSLFGGSNNIANDQFIDGLVSYAQQLGIQGLTHDDVVHLMIGGWGTNYQGATTAFLPYLQNIINNPNQDVSMKSGVLSFGGGYVPGHTIIYTPNSAVNKINLASTINPLSTASLSPILIFLAIGAGIFIILGAKVK